MIGLKKSGAITFLTQVIVFVIGFAASIILARYLGPTDRGVYALIILIPSFLGALGTLGIEISNVYFSANKKYKLDDITSNSLILSIVLGLIIILIFLGVYFTGLLDAYFHKNNITTFYLYLALFTLPLILLNGFLNRILLGAGEIFKFNSISIYQNIFQLILLIFLLIIFTQGLLGTVVAYIITTICETLLVILSISKVANIRLSFNTKLLKDSICYGGKGYVGNITQLLNYRLDTFLVAYFLDAASVGYYAIAVGLAEKLWMIPGSIGTVLFPRVASIGNIQANQITPKVSRHTLFILFLASIGLLALAKPFIQLMFGSAFLPSVNPLIILLPGIVTLSLSKVLTSDLAGRGKPEFGALSSFVSLAVNVPLIIFLVPKWGICGAAFASTVAYTLATVVVIISFVRVSNISLVNLFLIKTDDFGVYSGMFNSIMRKISLFKVKQ